jgi:hypothetical protein
VLSFFVLQFAPPKSDIPFFLHQSKSSSTGALSHLH